MSPVLLDAPLQISLTFDETSFFLVDFCGKQAFS